uniref:Uncharacterized protein n=1 Tax=Cajanus cajan TaxID=3821 RepID=A0A151QS87_CAJCA|nr:hypothetical protein KK1_045989 [Cajanus cajan]
MTRRNPEFLHPFDPEIDRTYHRLVREHIVPPKSDTHSVSVASEVDSTENMGDQPGPRERTLREMAAPDFTYESLCIQYPEEDVPFVLKTRLIHLLPKFHGRAGGDPHKHLKEFHIVCSTMRPHNVPEDHIYLKAFSFSLEDLAKDWLYYLAPGSITSWDDLKRVFLKKFFLASKTTAIWKDISGIRQLTGESLYEYWERFKRLCASCPHHQISEQLLLQYFYEGLNIMDKSMIDAASGGALGDMTPASARGMIEKTASNSQQFNMRSDAIVVRGVHDVVASDSTEHKKLESKIDALTTLVSQLAANQKSAPPPAKVCGICTSISHPTDACPFLQDSSIGPDAPQAYAANIYNNRPPQQQQQNYDFSSNRYNPGWRNHPNLRWGNSQQQQQNPPPFQNNPFSSTYQPPQQRLPPAPVAQPAQPSTSFELSLEELVRQMTIQNMQFQQETRASIQSLTNQMG